MNPELAALEGVEGWLTGAQAQRLLERARAVRSGGTILEIGSFRGRSTITLALGAGEDVSVVAVDPHAGGDRGPQQIHGSLDEGEADRVAFETHLKRAGVADRVRYIRLASSAALDEHDSPLDLLYVDGAHRYGPARGDLGSWGARVRPGGTLLVHDAFSSVGVTLAILRVLAPAREFVYVGRVGSLAEYRRAEVPLHASARARNAARQIAQLPWFARNLAIKVALVLKLRRLALAMGHEPDHEWPF